MEEWMIEQGPNRLSRVDLTGFLVLNKPSGPTSRALVDRVVRWIPGLKVGHAGTLDPLATGVLIVCIGSATRLVEMVQELPKSYRTKIRLGGRSDTLDAQGPIAFERTPRVPSGGEVDQAVAAHVGEVAQTPPVYSAVKIKGRRSHELARAGRPIQPGPKLVRIDRIAVLGYEWPDLELEIDCGSGTYIRSIARDLGEALGCGAYVTALVRTRIGEFTLEQAVDPDTLSVGSIAAHLRPLLAAVPSLPRVVLGAHCLDAIGHGRRLTTAHDLPEMVLPGGDVALIDQAGNLVALGTHNPDEGWIQPTKVLMIASDEG
jgi:tRNA pseudouridine55 synthase